MPADKTPDASVALREAGSMSVFCRTHPLAVLRPELRKQGVVTARQLHFIPSGRRVRVSGLLVIVHTPLHRDQRPHRLAQSAHSRHLHGYGRSCRG